MLWANLIALIPLGIGLIVLCLALFAAPPWSTAVLIGTGVAILFASILLHELLHGIVLQLSGHPPRFVFHFGGPHADIPEGHFLTRRQYLVMALTPFVAMTALGGFALLFLPPSLGKVLLAILLLNSAASVGDLYVAREVRLAPTTAVFSAEQEGIQVFVPVNIANEGEDLRATR
jgi:hypothetical protein